QIDPPSSLLAVLAAVLAEFSAGRHEALAGRMRALLLISHVTPPSIDGRHQWKPHEARQRQRARASATPACGIRGSRYAVRARGGYNAPLGLRLDDACGTEQARSARVRQRARRRLRRLSMDRRARVRAAAVLHARGAPRSDGER